MHHLLNAATAARLTVLLTAATLVLVCLQLAQVPAGSRSLAGPPRLELTDASAAGAPAARPLTPPATVLHEQQAADRADDRAVVRRPKAQHRTAQARHRTQHKTEHARKHGHGKRDRAGKHARGRAHHRAHRGPHHRAHHRAHHGGDHRAHHRGHHPGQAGRRTADRGAPRGPVVWGGRDISWPQCARHLGIPDLKGVGLPLPEPGVRFVIVGLTNGRAFTRNPCLGTHLRWVRNHHVFASAYAFTTYPTERQLRKHGKHGPFTTKTLYGRLRNAGYAAATYNIRTMQRHHFRTPHVWLDVEASSSRPWSGRVPLNRSVVQGWVAAYRHAGYRVGFYSTEHIWGQILGRSRFGLPEWRTAGPDTARAALGRCRESSFQGGPAVVAQWWTSRRDFDRMCPGYAGNQKMRRFFHKY